MEWTDFYLVLFLDFLLDCLCQLASQMTGPGPPGATWATLPPLDRCTSPFWDTSTNNFLPVLRHLLPPESKTLLPDCRINRCGCCKRTRDLCLDQELPSLSRLPSARGRLQGQRLGPHLAPFLSFVLSPIGYIFVQDHSSTRAVGDKGASPPWWWWDQDEGGWSHGGDEGKEKTAITSLALL